MGSKNRKPASARAAIRAGDTPLEFLLKTMRDTKQPHGTRLEAAKAAAPYCHSRLNAVTINPGDPAGLRKNPDEYTNEELAAFIESGGRAPLTASTPRKAKPH